MSALTDVEPFLPFLDALRGVTSGARARSPNGSPQRTAVCYSLAEAALGERRLADGFAAIESGLAAIAAGFARFGHSQLLRVRAALRRANGEAPDRVRADLEAALASHRRGAGGRAYTVRVAADLATLTTGGADRRSSRLRIARNRTAG